MAAVVRAKRVAADELPAETPAALPEVISPQDSLGFSHFKRA